MGGVLAGQAVCFAVTGGVVAVTAVLTMAKGARGRGALRGGAAVV
ncbi:hypothetical protein [Streptomyces sp. NPDC005374]